MHRRSIFDPYRNVRNMNYEPPLYAMDLDPYDHSSASNPSRKRTQQDQDKEDEQAYRKAMENLVQSWMDRLQLISLITTFFASIEAGLLQTTTPEANVRRAPNSVEAAANAGLLGALVLHTNAAIISFLAAFFLIRYKVKEAGKDELRAERAKFIPDGDTKLTATPAHTAVDMTRAVDMVQSEEQGPINETSDDGNDGHLDERRSNGAPPMDRKTTSPEPPILSTNPHLVQVGPFQQNAPTHLLGRCHSLCIQLSAAGFVLAAMGIICFAWARHPFSVSVFSSAMMLVSIIAGGIIFVWP